MKRIGRRCYICGTRAGNKRRVRIGIEKRWVCLKCLNKDKINWKQVFQRTRNSALIDEVV